MTCLPDVNVWLALTVAEHVHHRAALGWYERSSRAQLTWVRVTQMGFLRLLTNPKVMGKDVLAAAAAWRIWNRWSEDPRVIWSVEPPSLDIHWRKATHSARTGANFWTDAYLCAFAAAAGFGLVTFDRGMARTKDIPWISSRRRLASDSRPSAGLRRPEAYAT